jgi:hypothetical protein
MSTKTNFKRVALVAVASLGLGVLTSVAPANAANVAAGNVTVTAKTDLINAGACVISTTAGKIGGTFVNGSEVHLTNAQSDTSTAYLSISGPAIWVSASVAVGTTAGATVTPTTTPEITRPCSVSGTVTYNLIDSYIQCPSSKQFQDCETGKMYYTTNKLIVPSMDVLSPYMIFKANVNGVSRCISFVGINMLVIGIDVIELVAGVIGYSNLGECVLCTPDIPPSPTPTMTPTPSITPSITPTMSPPVGFYVYKQCNSPFTYLIQTSPGPSVTVGQSFKNTTATTFNDCWSFEFYSSTYPTLPLGSTFIYLSGNNFTNSGTIIYGSCKSCNFSSSPIIIL